MNKIYRHGCLLTLALALFSCHSKKTLIKGEPAREEISREVVKPPVNLAEKYAAIIGVNKSDIHNGRLYSFIDEWWGTPYKYGGNDKYGVDCSALAQTLEQEVYGITIPRTTSEQVTVIKRKYEEELQEGDLVFFDYDGGKFNHVAVYLQNGYIVHASSTRGVTIVRLHDPSIYSHFSRAGSIIQVSEGIAAGK